MHAIQDYLDVVPIQKHTAYGKYHTYTTYYYEDGVKALVRWPTNKARKRCYPQFSIIENAGLNFGQDTLNLEHA